MMADRERLLSDLLGLRAEFDKTVTEYGYILDEVHPSNRYSAENLLNYLVLRREDRRQLQDELTASGLSSLRWAESHVRENLNKVISWLNPELNKDEPRLLDAQAAGDLIRERNCHLFNSTETCPERFIMVTLDAKAKRTAEQYSELLKAGMNCARINTGHDNPEEWDRMISEVRKASELTERNCSIFFDLAGPKIRVSAIYGKHGDPKKKYYFKKGHQVFITEEEFGPGFPRVVSLQIGTRDVLKHLSPGQRILFDDGVAGAEITSVEEHGILVEITHTDGADQKIKLDKGVLFPGLKVDLPAVTEADLNNLNAFADKVDLIGISFVHKASEIIELVNYLNEKEWNHLGVVAKIETYRAFDHLPEILFALMHREKSGVMIARGDLGLEVGFERLAEVQEEILWLCEAGLMPAIWATQVLEKLTKRGVASRAEISDAALSVRAECVMLNKGAYILDSVLALTRILNKMSDHQKKKRPQMRRLSLAGRFFLQNIFTGKAEV
jgi:pyruvate kinase